MNRRDGWSKTAGLACMALLLATLLNFGGTGRAVADSWVTPRTEVYASADKAVRLTVTPGRASYGEPGGKVTPARGVLEKRDPQGRWTLVWDRPLLNPVAPVDVLVAQSGDYVVTFDDWYSTGTGRNVVVIYGPGGTLVRSLRLTDIVPEAYVEGLGRSVSSLQWAGQHRLAGPDLILQVLGPGYAPQPKDAIEITVDLASGRVRPPSGPEWDALQSAAQRVVAERREAQAREITRMTQPLTGPGSGEEEDWFEYLTEAFYRLTSPEEGAYPNTIVLSRPQAADYAMSLKWLRDAVRKSRASPGEVLMFGSPDADNLVAVLADAASKSRAGRLKGMRVYVAVDDARWPAVTAALGASGADLIQLDPGKPLPQRADRLPWRPWPEYLRIDAKDPEAR